MFSFLFLWMWGWRTFPAFFHHVFCSKPGSGVPVQVEVSNERHRERGRTAGSLEGSTPKAKTTEELTVRNNCGGSRKKEREGEREKTGQMDREQILSGLQG